MAIDDPKFEIQILVGVELLTEGDEGAEGDCAACTTYDQITSPGEAVGRSRGATVWSKAFNAGYDRTFGKKPIKDDELN